GGAGTAPRPGPGRCPLAGLRVVGAGAAVRRAGGAGPARAAHPAPERAPAHRLPAAAGPRGDADRAAGRAGSGGDRDPGRPAAGRDGAAGAGRAADRRAGRGNPFYSEELALALRDAGVIAVEGGVCRVAPTAGDLRGVAIPDTVQGVITSRIDRL